MILNLNDPNDLNDLKSHSRDLGMNSLSFLLFAIYGLFTSVCKHTFEIFFENLIWPQIHNTWVSSLNLVD